MLRKRQHDGKCDAVQRRPKHRHDKASIFLVTHDVDGTFAVLLPFLTCGEIMRLCSTNKHNVLRPLKSCVAKIATSINVKGECEYISHAGLLVAASITVDLIRYTSDLIRVPERCIARLDPEKIIVIPDTHVEIVHVMQVASIARSNVESRLRHVSLSSCNGPHPWATTSYSTEIVTSLARELVNSTDTHLGLRSLEPFTKAYHICQCSTYISYDDKDACADIKTCLTCYDVICARCYISCEQHQDENRLCNHHFCMRCISMDMRYKACDYCNDTSCELKRCKYCCRFLCGRCNMFCGVPDSKGPSRCLRKCGHVDCQYEEEVTWMPFGYNTYTCESCGISSCKVDNIYSPHSHRSLCVTCGFTCEARGCNFFGDNDTENTHDPGCPAADMVLCEDHALWPHGPVVHNCTC